MWCHKFLGLYLPEDSIIIVPNYLWADSNYQQLSQNKQNIYQPSFHGRGGADVIFLAETKALALSGGGYLPKPAIFNSCSRTVASFLASISASKSAFSCSAFNSNSRFSHTTFNSNSPNSRNFFNSASLILL